MRVILCTAICCMALISFAADQPTGSAQQSVSAANTNVTLYYELPPAPAGCLVRVYPINPSNTSKLPIHQTNWVDYLRSLGMQFPKGGFALFIPEKSVLIVANTEEQLALMNPMVDTSD